MNAVLTNFDIIFSQIQMFVDPQEEDSEQIMRFKDHNLVEQRRIREEALHSYHRTLGTLRNVLKQMSSNEIVEGYLEGSRLLRKCVAGYMAENFSNDFVPTMIDAVKASDKHTGWLFLQTLANHLGKDISPLVLSNLAAPGIRETALSVAGQLDLSEAIPIIRDLINDPVHEIAALAKLILSELETKRKNN